MVPDDLVAEPDRRGETCLVLLVHRVGKAGQPAAGGGVRQDLGHGPADASAPGPRQHVHPGQREPLLRGALADEEAVGHRLTVKLADEHQVRGVGRHRADPVRDEVLAPPQGVALVQRVEVLVQPTRPDRDSPPLARQHGLQGSRVSHPASLTSDGHDRP